jgi:hypothetical protein
MAGVLFGVSPRDPLTFVSVAILLGAIALLACCRQGRSVIALRNP